MASGRPPRYYIRHCPLRDVWLFEHELVDLDQEMLSIEHDAARASAVSAQPAIDFPLIMRFGNPPGAGEELFRWPPAGQKKPPGVFKALKGGFMQQLRPGDPMVMQRGFFRLGLPTIRSPKWTPGFNLCVSTVRKLVLEVETAEAAPEEEVPITAAYEDMTPQERPSSELAIPAILKSNSTEKSIDGNIQRLEPKKTSLTTFLEFVGVSTKAEIK